MYTNKLKIIFLLCLFNYSICLSNKDKLLVFKSYYSTNMYPTKTLLNPGDSSYVLSLLLMDLDEEMKFLIDSTVYRKKEELTNEEVIREFFVKPLWYTVMMEYRRNIKTERGVISSEKNIVIKEVYEGLKKIFKILEILGYDVNEVVADTYLSWRYGKNIRRHKYEDWLEDLSEKEFNKLS